MRKVLMTAVAVGLLLAGQVYAADGGAVPAAKIDPALLDALKLDALRHAAQEMPISASGTDFIQNQQPILLGGPPPAGGLPSTVVEPLGCAKDGTGRLRILRAGAVSVAELVAAGFTVE